ncbi:uncharacterized protein LOC124535439 [Vanessa cardui]|uniref:uncharacterized protein LOC124535439 n=1 Tax=Vanessa cardui TaxID=171605 RepID=UPI001F140907|nr:uncharacterized protein LOC124535439 [Vanessa cardui]
MALGIVSQYPPSSFMQPMPGVIQGPMGQVGGPMMMPSMQMPQPFPQRRLPIMMMPYHSKDSDKKYMKRKKRRPKKYYESESIDSDSRSSSEYLRSRRHGDRKKKRQVLTPVISYVTRNGRVVYQKKIKKENAGDWLEMGGKKKSSKIFDEMDDD